MKSICAILLGFSSLAAAQTATINLQMAVTATQEGQREAAHIKSNWGPEAAALDAKQASLKADREKLERESKRVRGWWLWRHAMSPKEKQTRERDLDARAKALVRETDDDRAGVERETRRVIGRIGPRLIALMETYAKEHGYSVVLDSGQKDGPVVVALNDITRDIVRLYDQAYPAEQ